MEKMNKNDIKISRVENLSQSVMQDCYYVISQSFFALADNFYHYAQRDVNHNNHILFVAKTPIMIVGVLKGMVIETPGTAYAKIDCFCVDKKYRGRGIGKQLLDAYENYVRTERGASCVGLQSSVNALLFYRNNGYAGNVYLKKNFSR